MGGHMTFGLLFRLTNKKFEISVLKKRTCLGNNTMHSSLSKSSEPNALECWTHRFFT